MTITVAVTGASGFIGRHLVKQLIQSRFNVITVQRSGISRGNASIRRADLSKPQHISPTLFRNVDVVIHAAALVHSRLSTAKIYNTINIEATDRLFQLAKTSNVKKFIFISTVSVYGLNSAKVPIDINFPLDPKTPYAESKMYSEKTLLNDDHKAIKVAVIRLPLVRGKGAPGNYGALEKLAKSGLPLPFSLANNRRSSVRIETVTKILVEMCENEELHLGLNLLADDPPVSTKKIIEEIGASYGISSKLFWFPKPILKTALMLFGKKTIYDQLYEDLVFVSTIRSE